MLRCTKEERQSAAFLLEDGRKVVLRGGVRGEREGWWLDFLCGGNHFWGRRKDAKRWRRLFKTSEHFSRWVLRHDGGGPELAQTAFLLLVLQEHYANGSLPP